MTPKIEVQKIGNWGERTQDYYRAGVTCDGAAAEGCTVAKITEFKPQPDGGLKIRLFVDVHVLPEHKGSLVDEREQEHPDGFKKFLKNINNDVLIEMVRDKHSYNSAKEFAEGRARQFNKLFKAERREQDRWHTKGGRHDFSRPEFQNKKK